MLSSLIFMQHQVVVLFLPILIPVFLSLVLIRLGMDTHASRARIRLLENDPSRSNRLVRALWTLEKEVDDAVADMLDEPGTSDPDVESPGSVTALTQRQKRMISSLNRLPQLRKHFAFISETVNSHAVIISRDVTRFVHHRRGEGVLRHLADHFELQ